MTLLMWTSGSPAGVCCGSHSVIVLVFFFSFNHLFKFAADIPDDGSLTVLEALIHRRLQVPSVSLSPSINILL